MRKIEYYRESGDKNIENGERERNTEDKKDRKRERETV